jgi:hypothetical protein
MTNAKVIDATLPDPRKVELNAGNFWNHVLILESYTNDEGELIPTEPRTVVFPDGSKELLSTILENRKNASAQA